MLTLAWNSAIVRAPKHLSAKAGQNSREDQPMTRYELLGLVIGWILTIIIAAFALKILIKVWRDEINLEYLISDANGDASLSRFQFLVFTFVVAMSLFYLIVIKSPPDYPAIPNQILALLGISGGSYVLGKGIQAGSA